MAYLNKERYEARQLNAEKRAKENSEKAQDSGMTQEQTQAITNLCRVRHLLHTNMDNIAKNDNNEIKKEIIRANKLLEESGLSYINSIPLNAEEDYIAIDTMEERTNKDFYDDIPDIADEKVFNDWWQNCYHEIYNQLEELNNTIERYIRDIDNIYNTHFAPTGALRIY